jgi:hypothetical protein
MEIEPVSRIWVSPLVCEHSAQSKRKARSEYFDIIGFTLRNNRKLVDLGITLWRSGNNVSP